MIKLKTTCPLCGKVNFVLVKDEDYDKYENGMHVQHAFPYLSASERELIITGICQKCWDATVGIDA